MFSASPSPLHIFGHQLNFEVVLPTGQGIPPCDVAAQPTLVQPASRAEREVILSPRPREAEIFSTSAPVLWQRSRRPHPPSLLQALHPSRNSYHLSLPLGLRHPSPVPPALALSLPASIAAISSNIHQFHSSREKREGGDKKSTWDGRISVGASAAGPWGERGRDSDPTEKEWDGSEHRGRKKERRLKSTDMTFIHFSSVVVVSPTTIIVIGMSGFK